MAPGILNTVILQLRLYPRYPWNEVNFSSARITFDRLYRRLPQPKRINNLFQCRCILILEDLLDTGTLFMKLNHASIIIACWDIHWRVYLLFKQVHISVDLSICNKPLWLICVLQDEDYSSSNTSVWTKITSHSIDIFDRYPHKCYQCIPFRKSL